MLGVTRRVKKELVQSEVGERHGENHDNNAIEPLAGPRGNRVREVDVFVALEPLRRQLEGPGKQRCRNEANCQDNDHATHNGLAQTEKRKNGLRDLDNQPG